MHKFPLIFESFYLLLSMLFLCIIIYQPRARARIGYKTGSTALLSRCLGVPDGFDFRLKNNQTGRPMQEFLLCCFPAVEAAKRGHFPAHLRFRINYCFWAI